MAAPVACRSTVRLVLLALLRAATALAQDHAPGPGRPEDVLASHVLKRSGTTWVLGDETTVLKNLRDARDLYHQAESGLMQRHQLEYNRQERNETIEQLRMQSDMFAQRIRELDQQLYDLVPPSGGNYYAQIQRDQLAREHNMLAAQLNQVNNELNRLREQSKDQDQKSQIEGEAAQSREKYMDSVIELRKSVDDVLAKYASLAKSADVQKALEALSATTKNKHKLGPSKALNDAIKKLEKSEGAVKSESIELHRQNGVDHVYATLGKVPAKMVFDTGAGLTTISSVLAKKIGLKVRPGDQTIELKTADGTTIKAKQMTIPSVRVSKFTVANVECVVMPEEKGDIDPLLGQNFFKHFKVEYSPEGRTLRLKTLETTESDGTTAAAADPDDSGSASKTTSKARRPGTRQPRASTKSRRPARGRSQQSMDEGEHVAPDAAPADPN
ncbi:MAG TPA: retroviral-like aspartic protease family protein [Isosphaeraceae bacterium]|nr:retroviral-like aspartic protease family protein [Isosphaeraceae bacterium]